MIDSVTARESDEPPYVENIWNTCWQEKIV